MARSAVPHRPLVHRPGRLPLALALGAGLVVLFGSTLTHPGESYTSPVGSGLNRKQAKSGIHNKDELPKHVLELPADEPEPEEVEKTPMPERRVPYTLHIVAQFPQSGHLKEESSTRQVIQEKLTRAFQKFEGLIRHVEVNLKVSEGFHKESKVEIQKGHHHGHHQKAARRPDFEVNDEDGTTYRSKSDEGSRVLAPYMFRATVTLKNHHTVVLANPEKHAQPTLAEALDHMVDVISNKLREEKDKKISQAKKERRKAETGPLADDSDDLQDEYLEAEEAVAIAQ